MIHGTPYITTIFRLSKLLHEESQNNEFIVLAITIYANDRHCNAPLRWHATSDVLKVVVITIRNLKS